MHDLRSWVGIGSRSQDFVGAVRMSRFTSDSEIGEKPIMGVTPGRAESHTSTTSLEPELGKEARIKETLLMKNLPKFLASS